MEHDEGRDLDLVQRWASRATAGELSLSMFLPLSALGVLVGYLGAFRVLMVWVHDRTESVLLAILMHVLTASC